MKRVRHIYIAEGYGRIDSDDPLIKDRVGMIGAASYFAELAADRELGCNAVLVDMFPGEHHRMKSGQRKHLPVRAAAKLDISGICDYHFLFTKPAGCGFLEYEVITIPIRVTRARGSREYYDEPDSTPPQKIERRKVEPSFRAPPFRKRVERNAKRS